jgi:hypothetical protein
VVTRVCAIDYRCENRIKVGKLKRQHLCHLIGLDSLFQKTPIIIPKKKKRTVQPGDAYEDTAFKPGFENVKF